jgi:hypothetical protein
VQAADSGGWGGAAPAGLLFADHGGRCWAFTDGVDLEECKCKLPIAEDGEGLLPQASCLPTMAAAVGHSQTGLILRSASASCR